MQTAENPLHSILERHCASLPLEIGMAADKLSAAMVVQARYHELARSVVEIIHRINGSSGSLGFRDLSAAASELEQALNASLRSGSPPDEQGIRHLHLLLSKVQSIIENVHPEDSHLYGADISNMRHESQAS